MPKAILIAGLGNQEGGLNLVGADVHLPGGEVELLDGETPHSLCTGQLDNGVPREQRGGGVGAGHAVAGVAADGPGVADLGSAHHVHGLA